MFSGVTQKCSITLFIWFWKHFTNLIGLKCMKRAPGTILFHNKFPGDVFQYFLMYGLPKVLIYINKADCLSLWKCILCKVAYGELISDLSECLIFLLLYDITSLGTILYQELACSYRRLLKRFN